MLIQQNTRVGQQGQALSPSLVGHGACPCCPKKEFNMDDRVKWNSKYKHRIDRMKGPELNPRLESLKGYLGGGTALDVASGLGGNSLFLAREGYEVESVDISDVAIRFIKEEAERRKLPIKPRVCDLTKLNDLDWVNRSFHCIVMTYYLDRSLFPLVKRMLKEKGYFFMETFYQSPQNNQTVSDKYKLRSNELLSEFRDWKVLYFEENQHEGRQTIFCQKLDL